MGSAVFAAWFMPNDPIASVHTHLALARYMQGDLAARRGALANTKRRCDAVGLPQGPFSLAYARQLEVLMRIEVWRTAIAPPTVAADLTRQAQMHGLDSWAMVGAAQQATVAALSRDGRDDRPDSGAAAAYRHRHCPGRCVASAATSNP